MNDHPRTDGPQRLHGLDALRLFLMLLGIPYHAALIYDLRPVWIVRSSHASPVLTDLSIALHSFRLGAFFILAGFFAARAVARRGPRAWLGGRLRQLGIPLLAGVALLTPPQLAIGALAQGAGLGEALRAPLAAAAHPSKLWVLHLWFLVDLILVCAAFGLCRRPLDASTTQRVLDAAGRLAAARPALMQAVLLAAFGLVALALQAFHAVLGVDEVSLLSGLIPLQSALYYGAFFLLGAALARSPALMAWFGRFNAVTLLLALLALGCCVLAGRGHSHRAHELLPLAQAASAVCVARLLFWAAPAAMRRPSARIRRASDAAFTVYLVHHPIVAALGLLCVRMGLPPLLGWSGIVVVATAASLAFHHRLVERSPLLALLLNGRIPAGWRRHAEPSPAAPTLTIR